LYAAYKGDQSKLSKTQQNYIKKIKVAEVTQKCLGVIEQKDEKDIVVTLINKGEDIPCSVTKSYFSEYDNQKSMNITITESATTEEDPRFVNIVASTDLYFPPNRPAGQEIQVIFSFDESQVIHVSIIDINSGEKTEIELSVAASSGSCSNKINKFTVGDELYSTKIPSKIDKFLLD
jgi:molecular chaperone DnaK